MRRGAGGKIEAIDPTTEMGAAVAATDTNLTICARWGQAVIEALERRYGGKRGFVRHLMATAQTKIPPWRGLSRVHWAQVSRFVFVCQGNVCRSAYAQAKAESLGLASASAGLAATPGLPANPKTMEQGAVRGISLDGHRTRKLEDLFVDPSDVVICMEPRQAVEARARLRGSIAQLTLLGFWSRPRRPSLTDPYGLGDAYWRTCLDIIDSAIEEMARQFFAHHSGSAPE